MGGFFAGFVVRDHLNGVGVHFFGIVLAAVFLTFEDAYEVTSQTILAEHVENIQQGAGFQEFIVVTVVHAPLIEPCVLFAA